MQFDAACDGIVTGIQIRTRAGDIAGIKQLSKTLRSDYEADEVEFTESYNSKRLQPWRFSGFLYASLVSRAQKPKVVRPRKTGRAKCETRRCHVYHFATQYLHDYQSDQARSRNVN